MHFPDNDDDDSPDKDMEGIGMDSNDADTENEKKEEPSDVVQIDDPKVKESLLSEEEKNLQDKDIPSSSEEKKGDITDMNTRCGFLSRIFTGWIIYFHQPVVFAGCSLALLYITVMGFDSVTTGFIYKNGISELVVGVCSAVGGLAGILGTVIFTRSRKRIGLERTGLFAFQLEVSCLVLAVISVWAPGSPFDPQGTKPAPLPLCSDLPSPVTVGLNETVEYVLMGNTTSTTPVDCLEKQPYFNISVILFLIGIITSRVGRYRYISCVFVVFFIEDNFLFQHARVGYYFYNMLSIVSMMSLYIYYSCFVILGLWMADLVVTQILQENVKESERGVVGGVQDSLNMLMDMIKFSVIITKPGIEFFGIHILWSFGAIFLASCLFAYHSWRVRGHLFHFDKLRKFMCNGEAGHVNPPQADIPLQNTGSHFGSAIVHA